MIDQDFFIDTQIKCPSCRKKGLIKINKKNIINNSRGITAIHISRDIICEHSFVAYLDKNLVVRDSFLYDFEISLPQFEDKQPKKEVDYNNIDTDIIKLNILPTLMINILRGIILGKKLLLININDIFLKEIIFDFLKIITNDSFQFELIILTRKEYLDNKKKYSNYIILDNTKIINDKEKIIDSKKKYVESKIVSNFFTEMEPISGLIVIKNELYKLYKFSEALIEFNKDFNEKKQYVINNAFDYFKERFRIDLEKPYLDLIEEIVENYFQIKLYKSHKATNFLGLI